MTHILKAVNISNIFVPKNLENLDKKTPFLHIFHNFIGNLELFFPTKFSIILMEILQIFFSLNFFIFHK